MINFSPCFCFNSSGSCHRLYFGPPIAKGGFGSVFTVFDAVSMRFCSAKFIEHRDAGDAEEADREIIMARKVRLAPCFLKDEIDFSAMVS